MDQGRCPGKVTVNLITRGVLRPRSLRRKKGISHARTVSKVKKSERKRQLAASVEVMIYAADSWPADSRTALGAGCS